MAAKKNASRRRNRVGRAELNLPSLNHGPARVVVGTIQDERTNVGVGAVGLCGLGERSRTSDVVGEGESVKGV